MSDKVVEEKLAVLTQLLQNPDREDGSILRIFHVLFQLSHEGRDLPPQTIERLSQIAGPFLSAQLLQVLTKVRLEVYSFQFAALDFIEIEDVINDLTSNDSLLSNIVPRGSFNRLKRELLELSPNQSTMDPASATLKTEARAALYNSLLESLSSGDKVRVMTSLRALVNDQHFCVDAFGAQGQDLLKHSANLLLSTKVSELIENLYLGEYAYLLPVNFMLDLGALKEDVATGGVLLSLLPENAFLHLKREVASHDSGNNRICLLNV